MKPHGRLMDMLTGYAAAHQHPFNIFVHLIGIPTIMLGVMIPLTMIGVEVNEFRFLLAHVAMLGFFLFYLTLDVIFAIVFAVGAWLIVELAVVISAAYPGNASWAIAAACFFGGYAAQFIGHAVEKSMPVLVKHPIQANLAAPFFTVVEIFKLAGLREELFNTVQQQIALQRDQEAGTD